jgi:hypothetical protein
VNRLQNSKSASKSKLATRSNLREVSKVRRRIFVGLALVLAGLALAIEGFDLAYGSGLLFGDFVCFGGLTCGSMYDTLGEIFWQGFYLFVVGVVILIAGIAFLVVARRNIGKSMETRILSRSEKRSLLSSFVVVLIVLIFFLAPMIPFQKSYVVQPTQIFPRVDICYQNSPVVNSAVFEYLGYESASYLLFNEGNFVYSNCLVVSGTQ